VAVRQRQQFHVLPALPENIQWGFFDRDLKPRLEVASGDIVRIETVSNIGQLHAQGLLDDQIAAIYETVQDRGPGNHVLTGPVAVANALPGNALEVRVLDLQVRHPYGISLNLPGGILGTETSPKTVCMLWNVSDDGDRAFPIARFKAAISKLPLAEVSEWEDIANSSELSIPTRFHLGTAGLALADPGRWTTLPPRRVGGNVDQWRFGVGTSMFYPVEVPGALFSCGDAHLAQGDGEVAATGIESHMTATLQFIVHDVPWVHTPVLSAPDAWILHAFGDTLDEALSLATREALNFLVARGRAPSDAYALLSLAVDFGITQAVDHKLGVHAVISKHLARDAKANRT
jgi:acetamidase/formamidase